MKALADIRLAFEGLLYKKHNAFIKEIQTKKPSGKIFLRAFRII
jgi:hypothetical protein